MYSNFLKLLEDKFCQYFLYCFEGINGMTVMKELKLNSIIKLWGKQFRAQINGNFCVQDTSDSNNKIRHVVVNPATIT